MTDTKLYQVKITAGEYTDMFLNHELVVTPIVPRMSEALAVEVVRKARCITHYPPVVAEECQASDLHARATKR